MGIRRDWYQSDERIILALLTKGAQNVKVDFQVKHISVSGTGKGRFSVYLQLREKRIVNFFTSPHKIKQYETEDRIRSLGEFLAILVF